MALALTNKKLIGVVVLIEAAILVAAFTKLIAPVPIQGDLHQSMGILQLTYCAVLPFFFRKRGIWVVSLLGFAAFCGFCLFALLQNLPCGCFGSGIVWEPNKALILLAVLIAASALALRECGWKGLQAWLLLAAMMVLVAVFGFLFASPILSVAYQIVFEGTSPSCF